MIADLVNCMDYTSSTLFKDLYVCSNELSKTRKVVPPSAVHQSLVKPQIRHSPFECSAPPYASSGTTTAVRRDCRRFPKALQSCTRWIVLIHLSMLTGGDNNTITEPPHYPSNVRWYIQQNQLSIKPFTQSIAETGDSARPT